MARRRIADLRHLARCDEMDLEQQRGCRQEIDSRDDCDEASARRSVFRADDASRCAEACSRHTWRLDVGWGCWGTRCWPPERGDTNLVGERYAEHPALGVDVRGDQTAAWMNYLGSDPAEFSVQTATRLVGSDSWSAPRTISGVNEENGPEVALARSGAGVIAWTYAVNGGRGRSCRPRCDRRPRPRGRGR